MRFQFDGNQQYQLRAIEATADLFRGQPRAARARGHGAQNYSRLSRMALNLIKRGKTLKASVKGRRLYAGRDHDYVLQLMQQ